MPTGDIYHSVQQQCDQRDPALLQRDAAEREIRDLPVLGVVLCPRNSDGRVLHVRDPGTLAQYQKHAGAHKQREVRHLAMYGD